MNVRRITRYTLIIACACVALIALVLLGISLVDERVYTDYIKQRAIGEAKRNGVTLSYGKSSLSYRGFSLNDLDLFFPRAFLMIKAQTVTATPNYQSFLSLTPQFTIHADAYGGSAHMVSSLSRVNGLVPSLIEIKDLQIARHPQIEGFGITDGVLNLQISPIRLSESSHRKGGPGVEEAEGTLSLSNISKPKQTFIPGALMRSPVAIPIPPILGLNASCKFKWDQSALTVSEIEISSAWGELNGKAVLQRSNSGELKNVEGEFKGKLTAEGLPYLPLLSNGTLSGDTPTFSLSIRGNPSRPEVKWRRG